MDVWRASELTAESTSVGCPALAASFALSHSCAAPRLADECSPQNIFGVHTLHSGSQEFDRKSRVGNYRSHAAGSAPWRYVRTRLRDGSVTREYERHVPPDQRRSSHVADVHSARTRGGTRVSG
jgi:hypothetical protein